MGRTTTARPGPANDLTVTALDECTWPAFDALVERNHGVWGGCWCLGFHPEAFQGSARANRQAKQARVRRGDAHAALVMDGDSCVGWCQFGSPTELPRIKHRRACEAGVAAQGDARPDWRITCFFTDKRGRHRGVGDVGLAGALDLIAGLGGGTVESFPEDVEGRKVSSSFLYNGTLALFERHGFERVRPLGKNHWLVRTRVAPTA
jgi:hypothetical protein